MKKDTNNMKLQNNYAEPATTERFVVTRHTDNETQYLSYQDDVFHGSGTWHYTPDMTKACLFITQDEALSCSRKHRWSDRITVKIRTVNIAVALPQEGNEDLFENPEPKHKNQKE